MDSQNLPTAGGLSAEELELLALLMEEEGLTAPPPQTILPRTQQTELPLSFAQQRLWFLDQWEPGNAAYNIAFALQLTGRLNIPALQEALHTIVARHEALRTTFATVNDQPVQVIAPAAPVPLPLTDLSHLPEPEREAEVRRRVLASSQTIFDLAQGPLFVAELLRLRPDAHIVLFAMHHIISDGWSSGVFQREMIALYTAVSQGRPSPLPPLPIQYADFALWQRQWLQGEILAQQLSYWQRQLADLPVLELPTDRPRPPVQSHRGVYEPLSVPLATLRALEAVSKRSGVTLFMTLLAAFQVLLSRWSGQQDLAVGSPIANRDLVEVEPLIGFFVNTLILRADLRGNPRFVDLLVQTRDRTLDAYAHQNVPFEQLVEVLRPERDPSRPPLFQVMFALQNLPQGAHELPELTITPLRPEGGASKFDLMLGLAVTPAGLRGNIEYSTDLFDRATIQRMIRHFTVLLEQIGTAPERRIAELALLTPEERHTLLVDWNTSAVADADFASQGIHDLITAQAARTPEAIAVVSGDETLSYATLNTRANQLAHALRDRGVGPDVLVGLCLPRSLDAIVALLAIWKAGGAYVPLDPTYPAARLQFLLADSGIDVLITHEHLLATLPPFGGAVICLDRDRPQLAQQPTTSPAVVVPPDALAYLIYTSGSTGQPKGVLVPQRALVSYVRAAQAHYRITAADRVLQFATLTFDASAEEICTSLGSGATLVLRNDDLLATPETFFDACRQWQISVLSLPTAFWQLLAEAIADGTLPVPETLRLVIIGGERVVPARVAQWQARLGERCTLINTYGPTETTIVATAYPVPASVDPALSEVPIGRPLAHLRAYVLDDWLQPVPIGVRGELYLGGLGLARGYRNRPALTAETFVPDAFSGEAGARLYRTGDLVRYLPNGTIIFLGRVDGQVKVRGFRIEPDEITAVLEQHPSVLESIVVGTTDPSGQACIVAYVVAAQDTQPGLAELRSFLRQTLPEYMLPATVMFLPTLPRTTSGKIDRRALPAPDHERRVRDGAIVAPRTPAEELVAGVWSAVLGVREVGAFDHFFALGGHSLLATQAVARLRKTFGKEIPLRLLFEVPVVADLAARLSSAPQAEQELPGVPLRPYPRSEQIPLSFAQQRLWFLDQLDPGSASYHIPLVVRLHGTLDPDALARSLTALVARHEALRTTITTIDDQPVQSIAPTAGIPLPVIDLQAPSEDEIAAAIRAEVAQPFDLRQGPLLRARLLRLHPEGTRDEQILILTLHHIVTDGWSQSILLRELTMLYQSCVQAMPIALPALPIQYADYAVWQRQWLQGAVLEQQIAYWRRQLAGVTPIDLPTDYPRSIHADQPGAVHSFTIPAAISADVQHLSQQLGATVFMTLLAAWQILLSRYSRQTDIAVGVPIAGRTRPELEGLIGFFVNTLVLRADLAGQPTFAELVNRVRAVALDAYAHQDVPFELLVETLQPERDLSRTPLFQVMFTLQNTPRTAIDLPGLTLEPVAVEVNTAKFDLSLILSEQPQGLSGSIEYRTDLFEAATIERLVGHYQTLLSALVAEPHNRINDLPLLTEAERRQLLVEWNASTLDLPLVGGIHELVEAQVARTPNAIAVSFSGTDERVKQLTYADLNARANQLASYLREQGVGPEICVGIAMEPALELVVAILGVLKAGGAYVPIDPAYPAERLHWLFADSRVALVLTQQRLLENLPAADVPVLALDRDWTQIAARPTSDLARGTDSDQLAYMIYTSGSTGTPKGVMLAHRGVINNLTVHQAAICLSATDRMLLNYSISFDPSIWSIFWPLITGAQLVLVPSETRYDSAALVHVMDEQGISVFGVSPSQLAVLIEEPGIAACTHLRYVVCGGENLSRELQARFFTRLPAVLCNAYGPTEATIDTTFWHCPRVDAPQGSVIGRPLSNVRVYVLDRAMQPVPVGVAGELYIGGIGLARGYHRRPDLTAERFVPDPFGHHNHAGAGIQPHTRLYKTGDLVRYRPDGALEFLGRIDQQVKLRGFRIELGEIEATLEQHAAVQSAVVVIREDRPGDKRIVAYVVPKENQEPRTKNLGDENEAGSRFSVLGSTLRAFLAERLPEYMVPAAFVLLDTLPLTPSDKLDRQALPAPDLQPEDMREMIAPRTPVEEVIAGVWASVLGREQISVHDNFFALGGHSLLATQVVTRLRAVLGLDLPLRLLFEAPTIASFAGQLAAQPSHANLPLVPLPRDSRPLPLSFAQQRLWFLDQLQPEGALYTIPLVVRLSGPLNSHALRSSLSALLARHESLRTTFAYDLTTESPEPYQRIAPAGDVALPVVELPLTADETTIRAIVQREVERPFDLQSGPLLRALLIQQDATTHLLVLVAHHIVNDGWSQSILLRELTMLYQGFVQAMPIALPALPIQYADYAVWQRQWLQGAVLEQQIAYWRRQLAGVTPIDLPADRPRPAVASYRGAYQAFHLPAALSDELRHLSQRLGATLFMTLLAAWQTLLMRYSGQTDIAVGTPIAGRVRPELEDLIGFFVNTLVLRADLAGQPTFAELVARVRTVCLDAYAHQDIPFDVVVEQLQPTRDLSRHPLFQVMFTLQNTPRTTIDLPELRVESVSLDSNTAKFDLSLALTELPDGLQGAIEYATDLFDAATVARMAGHFQQLLAAIVADPSQRVTAVPLLTADERQQLLIDWNATALDVPAEASIPQAFAAQAARTPDATALIVGTEHLSYRALNQRANQLAHALRQRGIGPEVRVGVCLQRSADLLVALLAVLTAGGCYVPLDPAYPQQRLQFMLADAQAPLLLTHSSLIDRLPTHDAAVLCLDTAGDSIASQPTRHLPPTSHAVNLAYLIYTSGSTGQPKGVAITHHSAAVLLAWAQQVYTREQLAGVLAATSVCFDLSVFELVVPLSCGGTVILADTALDLPTLPAAHNVTLLNTVPSAATELLRMDGLPAAVRTVNLAGEPLSQSLVHDLYARGTVTQVFNLYGPSEDTTYSTWALIPQPVVAAPPIGRPIANTQAYVLDAHGQPVPLGVAGELYLGGAGLARGYLNRPDLTAERFVPDPFGAPGSRLYRTGDRVRYRPDGNLEFLGRIDHQVKLRGFRIELDEIAAVLRQHAAVAAAVAIVRHDVPGDPRLVAYVVAEQKNKEQRNKEHGGAGLHPAELRCFLEARLPHYMIPSAFVLLDALPLTPNGKLDRKALPAPDAHIEPSADRVLPRTPVEEAIARIWARVLGRESIGVHDDFFALGGHSLLVVRVMTEIRQQFGHVLPLATLLQAPTIAQLALQLEHNAPAPPWSPLVPLQSRGERQPFFCVHPIGGTVFCYADLARALGPDQPIYGLQARGLEAGQRPHRSIPELATEYIAAIRSVQPHGPYLLGGWSFGGLVAFEIASQLQQQGEEIRRVVLIDSAVPPRDLAAPDEAVLLAQFAHDLGGLLGAPVTIDPADLAGLTTDERLVYILEQSHRQQVLPPDMTLEQLRRLADVFAAHLSAMRNYEPALTSLPLALVAAEHPAGTDTRTSLAESWQPFANVVAQHVVPGTHYTLLRQPQLQAVAAWLGDQLVSAQAHPGEQP